MFELFVLFGDRNVGFLHVCVNRGLQVNHQSPTASFAATCLQPACCVSRIHRYQLVFPVRKPLVEEGVDNRRHFCRHILRSNHVITPSAVSASLKSVTRTPSLTPLNAVLPRIIFVKRRPVRSRFHLPVSLSSRRLLNSLLYLSRNSSTSGRLGRSPSGSFANHLATKR